MNERCRCLATLLVVALHAVAIRAAAPPMSGRDRFGDPLPPRVIARLGTLRLDPDPARHRGTVRSLAFSADGRFLATGGEDGVAYVWDLATHQPRYRFAGHFRWVAGLAFSPDGRWLAAGDGLNNQGQYDYDASVWLYDLGKGRLVRRFSAHLDCVHTLRFSPDGKKLATAGNDARIRLWDVATGRRLGQVRSMPHSRPVAFLAGGKSLLIHTWNGDCRLVETASLRTLASLTPPKRIDISPVAACLPDEKEVVVAGDGAVVWYGLPGGEQLHKFKLPIERFELFAALSADGAVLAIPTNRSTKIELWDLVGGRLLARLSGHALAPTVLAVSPDGRRLASGSDDSTVLLWDLEQLRVDYLLRELLAGRCTVRLLRVSPVRAIAILEDRLRQSARIEAGLRRWIRDLDDNAFAVRKKASAELEKQGAAAIVALQNAHATASSAEVIASTRRLLSRLADKRARQEWDLPRLRQAVTLLAEVDTRPARQALERLAKLEGSTLVGRLARQAIERLRELEANR